MELVAQIDVMDLVEEYNNKKGSIRETVNTFNSAVKSVEMACVIQGTYHEPVFYRTPSINSENVLIKNLASSFWRTVYNRLGLGSFISKSEKEKFNKLFSDPITDIDFDVVHSVFAQYGQNPRWHMLKGFAEVFSNLDQSYKSHDKVKIGVKALPKRIIVSGFGYSHETASRHREAIRSILNAISAYEGSSLVEFKDIDNFYSGVTNDLRGLKIKKFQNGNMHVMFNNEICNVVNKALSEFYGDVLCDSYEEKPTKREKSKDVAKDLQYYATPAVVAEKIISGIYIQDDTKVLEPSCGGGRLMEAVRNSNPNADVFGIEISRDRAKQAREKGFSVQEANFLEITPTPEFDFVVMNPPFYGKHYQKHVEHAKKFLKPGGTLVTILPATARYSHGYVKGHGWRDLPVASFAESGTNVPTGYYTYRAPR